MGWSNNGDGIPNPTSPVTGDLLIYDGSNWVSLPAGASGYFLYIDPVSGLPAYVSSSASVGWGAITGTLSSQTDLNNALNALIPKPSSPSVGQMLYWDGSVWNLLPQGNNGDYLKSSGSSATATWNAFPSIPPSYPPSGNAGYVQVSDGTNFSSDNTFTFNFSTKVLSVNEISSI